MNLNNLGKVSRQGRGRDHTPERSQSKGLHTQTLHGAVWGRTQLDFDWGFYAHSPQLCGPRSQRPLCFKISRKSPQRWLLLGNSTSDRDIRVTIYQSHACQTFMCPPITQRTCKLQRAELHSQCFWARGLGKSLRICIPYKSAGDVGSQTPLWVELP